MQTLHSSKKSEAVFTILVLVLLSAAKSYEMAFEKIIIISKKRFPFDFEDLILKWIAINIIKYDLFGLFTFF